MSTSGKHSQNFANLPLPVVLLLLSFATPPEMSIDLGGLRLSAYRLVVMAMIVPCAWRIASGACGKWQLSDTCFLVHGLWVILALIAYAGIGQGLESGGIYFVEAVGGYWVGRCTIRNAEEFVAVARLMLGVVLTMMVLAFVESVTGIHFIRESSRSILGGPPLPSIEPRLGLHRAFASFDHPILYGIFCASTLGMAVYVPSRRGGLLQKIGRPVVTTLATFFSLSSGAFSALGVQMFFISWDFLTRGIASRWIILGSIISTFWALITMLSNRGPVKVFLTYFTFSPGTGYNRLRIWEYGSAEVLRNPVIGIGLGEWERPTWMVSGSMDNFWLATAVRYGLPAFVTLAAAILCIVFGQVTSLNRSRHFANCRSAWMVSIIGLSIAACTVHFWNALFCLFCFLVGTGAWMAQSTEQS